MIRHHRDVTAWLKQAGADSIRLEHSGKHPKLIFRYRGVEHRTIISNTPSDPYAFNMAVKQLEQRMGLGHDKVTIVAARPRQERPVVAARKAALTKRQVEMIARLTPEQLSRRLDIAFRMLWRDAMRAVGGKSLI